MLLHDFLNEAVADVSADLPALADASSRRGLAIRRRRRALAAVGTAAAATVIAVGAYALVPGAGVPDRVVATDAPSPIDIGPLSGQTAPITGPGTAAALAFAVEEFSVGTFGGFQGDTSNGEAFAAFRFLPSSGSGPAGLVMINLQPLGMAGEAPYTCEHRALLDCRVWQRPNGDTVRTYRDDDSEMGVGSERLAVEVISPGRNLRVVVGALNTNPYADGDVRAVPVLNTEQLIKIATLPWWDRGHLPQEFVAAGERLQDYSDAGAENDDR